MFSPRIQIGVSGTPTSSAAPTPYQSETNDESSEEEFASSDEEEADLDSKVQNNGVSSTCLKNIQDHESMEFPINGECTSLSLSSSGNFLWAGFSDGTLRVFDLTGNFGLETDAAVASRQKSSLLVASKWCQTYGAVACQIHARGVHTDLITQVGVCDDYVFCGVSRGAMELYAVDFRDLEASAKGRVTKKENILDYLHVHEKADAKLKGFGACTRLKNAARPTYLLLTGKGIKNIHIWSFQPPLTTQEEEEPIWSQLYDTQTNGNTINLLGFYRPPAQNKLLGVSQSDSQKLRLWDLSSEEGNPDETKERAKRPPYVDVANSKAALGLAAGGFCVCGGPTMYNQLSIVSLDQPKNAYNHTELALPAGDGVADDAGGSRRSSSRRQRRGDLKQVANVASPPEGDANAGHVLLELDDGTIVQYTMSNTMASDGKLQILQSPTVPALPDDYWKRTICLASSRHHKGALMVAMSLYNPNTQRGKLVLRKLPGTEQDTASSKELAAASSKTVLQTPPPRHSTVSQPKPPVNAASKASPETDLAAIKTLCMAPPATKKSKSSKSDAERIKSKKERKKKRKQEKLERELLQNRRSDSELCVVESFKKLKMAESKRSLNLEADTLWKPKDKIKKKKQVVPEMMTPARESSKDVSNSYSSAERILVKKVKVIPLSGEKKVKKTVSAGSSPTNSVSISSPPTESDNSKNGDDFFETPAKKNPNSLSSSTATDSNSADTKAASLTTQVSPDSSVIQIKPAKTKTTGEMDRFVVSQKQLKMPQPPKKERSKNKPPKLTKEQKDRQEQLKVTSVPRKSRPNDETIAEEVEKEPVDETNTPDGAEIMLEEVHEEEVSPETTTKSTSKKKRPRFVPTVSTDDVESRKRKAAPEPEPKTPPSKKKFSAEDSPPTREDMHAVRVKAEYKRIQDLIAHLPAFVPVLLRQEEAPKTPAKSITENQERQRSKLESKHRAAHEMIQRRMLRAAESIIRNAVDFHLTVEQARNELKGTVQSYQEVVHETLQRHKLESQTLVAQQKRARGGLDVPCVQVHFPFQSTFSDLEDARRAIEAPRRLPGRPRTA
ncbi:unnamed protein product [Cylindrotheca closterium]|uniref:Uncharacterized protein n=1 Tax=Cylindrotheca closterium TaxID=2856 RepID=A0AAD2FPZ1_9STRA|nr:unnamed protein product [Cylindrotheca closterium]